MEPVQFISVSKSYGAHLVLRDLSVTVHPGGVTVLVGANGAGKSTFLRLAAGLTRPDLGEIRSAQGESRAYCGHRTGLYPQFTVGENLSFIAALKGDSEELELALTAWELDKVRHRELGVLSKGTQARVALCAAFLNDPGYLFLDEPSAALDDHGVALLRDHLLRRSQRLGGANLVLLATHDLGRLLDIAGRVIVLNSGTVLADSASPGGVEVSIAAVIERYHAVNR